MKLLVIGGSGFIGKNFIERHGEEHLLTAPTHRQLDVKDPQSLKRLFSKDYFDVVLHLADKITKVGDHNESDGLIMFKNVQYAAILNQVFRIVYVGDGAEYGTEEIVKAREEQIGEEIPCDPFGVTKYLVNALVQKDKISINLRHFMIYGKYASPYDNVISALAYHAVKNKDIILTADRTVSVISVGDSVGIINAAINGQLPKGDYNVCAQDVRLSQIARTLKKISGGTFEVKVKKRKASPEYTADNSKLLEALSGIKLTKLSNGLKELYAWMQEEASSFSEKKVILP